MNKETLETINDDTEIAVSVVDGEFWYHLKNERYEINFVLGLDLFMRLRAAESQAALRAQRQPGRVLLTVSGP